MASNMFAVNGVWLPNPSGLEVTYSVLDKYAERSIDGVLNREIAAKKLKYTLNWPYMPGDAVFINLWETLAALPEYASFTLPHPDGTMHTFEGYLGADLGVTMYRYFDMSEQRMADWQSLKASVIER